MTEVVINFDATAYMQLTDTFIYSRLFEFQPPESPFREAYKEFERRIIGRHMFRLIADFTVPSDMDLSRYTPADIIENTLRTYRQLHKSGNREDFVGGPQDLDPSIFRCVVAEFHMGMKRKHPLEKVLFHSSKDHSCLDFLKPSEFVAPLTQKVFLLFDGGRDAHQTALMSQLVASFKHWAESLDSETSHAVPTADQTRQMPKRSLSDPLKGGSVVQPGRVDNTPPKKKPRRQLQLQTSAPMDPPPRRQVETPGPVDPPPRRQLRVQSSAPVDP